MQIRLGEIMRELRRQNGLHRKISRRRSVSPHRRSAAGKKASVTPTWS